jgi:hypothetical protein
MGMARSACTLSPAALASPALRAFIAAFVI